MKDDAVNLTGQAPEDAQLIELRVLDERLRLEGGDPLLDDLDGAILDEVCKLGGIIGRNGKLTNVGKIAAVVEVDKSTVSRRLRRLIAKADYLQSFAKTLLGEYPQRAQPLQPEQWRAIKVLWTPHRLEPARVKVLYRWSMHHRGRAAARRLLNPPIGLQLERHGETIIITGPGPLSPELREAIRAGRAERIYDPPRCHACGQFVSRPPTGRPRKYCSERCRSRYRRRP